MKPFTEWQNNPEAQQPDFPWKWNALKGLLGRIPYVNWGLVLHEWACKELKHEWKGMVYVGDGE